MVKLTDGREVITAPNASAVAALVALGWVRVDAPAEEPAPVEEPVPVVAEVEEPAEAEASAEAPAPAPKPKRTTTKK